MSTRERQGSWGFGSRLDPMLKRARRIAIAVIGGTVLLATEFVWARRLLERVRARVRRAAAPDAPDASKRDSEERRGRTIFEK